MSIASPASTRTLTRVTASGNLAAMGNRAVSRALLGALLVLGLLGMHAVVAVTAEHHGSPAAHTTMAQQEHAETIAASGDQPEHGAAHSVMHLCLMVLTFLTGCLLLALFALRRPNGPAPARGDPGIRARARGRPPPIPAGRSLLNLVCIART